MCKYLSFVSPPDSDSELLSFTSLCFFFFFLLLCFLCFLDFLCLVINSSLPLLPWDVAFETLSEKGKWKDKYSFYHQSFCLSSIEEKTDPPVAMLDASTWGASLFIPVPKSECDSPLLDSTWSVWLGKRKNNKIQQFLNLFLNDMLLSIVNE